jgi:hypothetical protein
MMLGVLFQGPGCISKYGNYGYAKNENSNKIGGKIKENCRLLKAATRITR